MSQNGDTLNDSHAEVMCRRGFVRYLIEQINQAIAADCSIFSFNELSRKFQMKQDISFHFVTTHAPCGDASIYGADASDVCTDDEPAAKKLKIHQNDDDPIGVCLSSNFTGAKVICKNTDVIQDLMVQSIGEIRTKPGRGEPSLSVSCSDKLAKWNVLGLQGALLYSLLEKPIYFDSLTFCDSSFCNLEATERAIWKRFANKKCHLESFTVKQPTVQICQRIKFKYEKNDQQEPAPTSIVWCQTAKYSHQVAVGGKRQGVTKKKANTPSGRLSISKIELFRSYIDIVKKFNHKLNIYPSETDFEAMRYCDAKFGSAEYQNAWNILKKDYFHIWTYKPDHLNTFRID